MNSNKVLFISTILLVNFWCDAQLAIAQQSDYPSKPVRIIVPFPPGSSDTAARVVGQKLSSNLGQPFVVENRPGAGSVIGTDFVAKSPANGYTLLFQTCALAGNPCIYERLPYDTIKDFDPIGLVSYSPMVFVAHPSFPANSLKELIELAKAQPGKFNYANNGSGSISHLSFELFKAMAGVRITGVQYKGAGPSVIAVMSGEVQMMIGPVGATISYLKSGRLKAIALASNRRSSVLPDLPTMSDSGIPGFDAVCWYGLLAPRGTPPAIVKRLNEEIVSIMKMPDVHQQITGLGLDPTSSTPNEFGEHIKKEIEMYSRTVRDAGIARLPLK
ncbi:MAG: tripartite tricarboxylate transporter substrate binding protein [bacterium]